MTANSLRTTVLALVLAAASGCAELDTGQFEKSQIMWNQIMWNQIMWNSLTGTPEAIDELISYPLASESFDPVTGSEMLAAMVLDPNARVFLAYLVSCALEPGDTVIAGGETYEGAAGLCPDWADGPPSAACQEIVSACLIARNNKTGRSVQFSPRGAHLDGSAIPTADQVPVKWTDIDGDPIPSLEPCNKFSDPDNCGFERDASLLGQCSPGADVFLSCGALEGAEVRVCSGVEGCDDASAVSASSCGVFWFEPPVAFECPSGGVYGVMQRAATTTYNGALPTAPGFPATELEVYAIREGAFYGNLFDSSRRHPEYTRTVDPMTQEIVEVIQDGGKAVVYRDLWACNDPGWDEADAYMYDRLCAIVTAEDPMDGSEAELCVATALGACDAVAPLRCEVDDQGPVNGDGDYGSCRDRKGVVRSRSITTFLDGPCDMASNPDTCGYTP